VRVEIELSGRRPICNDHSGRPLIGDRIHSSRLGVFPGGPVHDIDELQMLIKLEDGRPENVRRAGAGAPRALAVRLNS
jgi:hypothetical protein